MLSKHKNKFIASWVYVKARFRWLLLTCISTITLHAQHDPLPSLNLGDSAPELRVSKWLKGSPVNQFEKGHVYVLEFWATWCRPCIAAMPHLSDLARQYKNQVSFIAVDIYEWHIKFPKSMPQVKAFVDSMGQQMDFLVAAEDSNFTVANWMEASGEDRKGIPSTFVVNGEGKLAWIGHPTKLDEILAKVVDNSWDINKASVERKEYRRLENLENLINAQLNTYVGDPNKKHDFGKPDSVLLAIEKVIKQEPELKFAPAIAFHTFSSLLKTDVRKAYEYGKAMLITPSYRGTDYNTIIYGIDFYGEKTSLVSLPPEMYELGADSYQASIDYDSIAAESLPKIYLKMADWYWRGKNNAKAVAAAQKAVDALKNEQVF